MDTKSFSLDRPHDFPILISICKIKRKLGKKNKEYLTMKVKYVCPSINLYDVTYLRYIYNKNIYVCVYIIIYILSATLFD